MNSTHNKSQWRNYDVFFSVLVCLSVLLELINALFTPPHWWIGWQMNCRLNGMPQNYYLIVCMWTIWINRLSQHSFALNRERNKCFFKSKNWKESYNIFSVWFVGSSARHILPPNHSFSRPNEIENAFCLNNRQMKNEKTKKKLVQKESHSNI